MGRETLPANTSLSSPGRTKCAIRTDQFIQVHVRKMKMTYKSLWRALFGLYLGFYFLVLIPYRNELYGIDGVFKDRTLFPWLSYFPRFLFGWESGSALNILFFVAVTSSLLLAIGIAVRVQAAALWLISVWMYNRNPFSDSPELPFVLWLLIGLVIAPQQTGNVRAAGWIVLSLSYSYAAVSKLWLGDPSWRNGEAFFQILTSDNSRRAWYGELFSDMNPSAFIPLTFGLLTLQLFAPAFVFWRKTRTPWWLAMTLMHVGALVFTNLNQLSLGMLLFHLFLIERWNSVWKPN